MNKKRSIIKIIVKTYIKGYTEERTNKEQLGYLAVKKIRMTEAFFCTVKKTLLV